MFSNNLVGNEGAADFQESLAPHKIRVLMHALVEEEVIHLLLADPP